MGITLFATLHKTKVRFILIKHDYLSISFIIEKPQQRYTEENHRYQE